MDHLHLYTKHGKESNALKIEKDELAKESRIPSYFFYFVNFFYHICLVPFALNWDLDLHQLTLRQNWLQRTICGIMHFGVLQQQTVWTIKDVLSLTGKLHLEDVIKIFLLIQNICFYTIAVFLFRLLWTKKRRNKFVSFIANTRSSQMNYKEIRMKAFGLMFCWLTIIITQLFSTHESRGEVITIVNSLTCFTTSVLKLILPDDVDETLLYNCFFLFVWLSTLLVKIFYIVLFPFFVLFVGLTARQLGKDFYLHLLTRQTINEGILACEEMKRKADDMNQIFGIFLQAFYLNSILAFARSFYVLGDSKTLMDKGVLICYLFIFSISVLFACEFHSKVQNATRKFCRVQKIRHDLCMEDRLKLISLLLEMETDVVALSTPFFVFTYRLLSSTLGVIMTYGILVLSNNRDSYKA